MCLETTLRCFHLSTYPLAPCLVYRRNNLSELCNRQPQTAPYTFEDVQALFKVFSAVIRMKFKDEVDDRVIHCEKHRMTNQELPFTATIS